MRTIAIFTRFGLLAAGLFVNGVGSLDEAVAQAKTRIAVTAFENKVKKRPSPPSRGRGQGEGAWLMPTRSA
jgi:hypothetical protein